MMQQERALAVGLSTLAGYAYAAGFLKLSVIFGSFANHPSEYTAGHTVNSSFLALIVAGLMVTFTVGVVIGSLVGHFARTYRRLAVLALVSALLAVATWFGTSGATWEAITALLLSMGSIHAVLEKDSSVNFDQEYTHAVQGQSGSAAGSSIVGQDWAVLASRLLLWVGFGFGAVGSVALFPELGLGGLWIASCGAALLAFLVLATGVTRKVRASVYRSRR